MYAFQTYEYDVMFKPGYSTRGRMIPAFDAGDEFRDLNIANIAYAREDNYADSTKPYDCSSRHTLTLRSSSSKERVYVRL